MTSTEQPQPHVPQPVDRLVEAIFGRLARWRGARPFHPRGQSYAGQLHRRGETGAAICGTHPSVPVLARLSTSLGLPPPLFDVFGLGIRLLDVHGAGRHQDLLLASSSPAPLARHLLIPTRGFERRFYSSVLAYRHAGRLTLAGARCTAARRRSGLHLDHLDEAAATGILRFELALATLSGPWRPFADIVLERRLADEESAALRFDPWNAAASFRPVGPLNHLRAAAYRASRRTATSP